MTLIASDPCAIGNAFRDAARTRLARAGTAQMIAAQPVAKRSKQAAARGT